MSEFSNNGGVFESQFIGKFYITNRLQELREKALKNGLRGDEVFEFIRLEVCEMNKQVKAENERLQAELARVREIAERLAVYYGDKSNWCDAYSGLIADKDLDEKFNWNGGKFAREMAKELKGDGE